ncbi:MAG: amidohydrolase family protein [Alphaproteobacteria bacterium]|nr:amidohydrolase family protein [Alphaproteobacteria bacterium]
MTRQAVTRVAGVALLALGFGGDALAGEPSCTAVTAARVHAPDGVHDGWDVVWQDGRIRAVGPGVAPATCAQPWPAGLEVTAGFVAAPTQLGLVEIELEQRTRDDHGDGDPVRAGLEVSLAYNPRSALIPVTRLGGITSALVVPTGGFVSGQAATVRLDGATQAAAVLSPSAGVVVDLDALGNRAVALLRLRELFADARFFERTRAGQSYEHLSELSASRLDLEALLPVLRREVPLIVRADRAADLEALVRVADEARVRLVVLGAAEGWLVADVLAASGVAVVVDPLVYGAGSLDQLHGRPDNAARLVAAGVAVVIAAEGTHNARSLRFLAGNAVRGGLAPEAALAAITATPAQVFGLTDRGALTVGAHADLALWTGDPLDVPGRLAGLVVDGVAQPLTSRQTALVDAWRTVPRSLVPADVEAGSAR